MQVVDTHLLLDTLPPEMSGGLAVLRAEVMAGFSRVVWPIGARQFTIRPVRKGNGVLAQRRAALDATPAQGSLFVHAGIGEDARLTGPGP